MVLAALQEQLATLYETPLDHRVDDFLITDATLARALESETTHRRDNAERLLLRESEEGLDLSLYIDAEVIASLEACDPMACLADHNLNDFLVALEGVSHFNYVIYNACHRRQVSQLELELQAEVDKFVVVCLLLDRQGSSAAGDRFHDALFEHVSFDESLDADTGQRYRDANRYAGKYCKRLSRRFPAQHREPSFVNEIRRFYRLAQHQKLRRIEHH
ncbi:MAG: hypothetical protein ACU85V_08575 [Gammaproteobacteria bacterium]